MHTTSNPLIFNAFALSLSKGERIKKHREIKPFMLRQAQHERLDVTCVHRLGVKTEGKFAITTSTLPSWIPISEPHK
jgi:hypothetical protein